MTARPLPPLRRRRHPRCRALRQLEADTRRRVSDLVELEPAPGWEDRAIERARGVESRNRGSVMKQATTNDLHIAGVVHRAIAIMPQLSSRRFGDRKVFISAIHDSIGLGTLDEFKRWLLGAMRLCDADGAPLVVLARADFVAAMDPESVLRSEIVDSVATFHFVLDRLAAPESYAPQRR